MGVGDLARVLRERWKSAVVVVVLAVGGVAAFSLTATPIYTSTASVYFSLPYGESAGDLSQGSTYTQAQMQSYAALATEPAVIEPVVRRVGSTESPRAFSRRIQVTASPDTVILEISASDPSPQRAADLANAVSNQLATTARRLSPKNSDGDATLDVQTIGEAVPPGGPSSPQTRRNLVAALLAGLLVGAAVAYLRDRLDTRVRTAEQVGRLINAPVLGTVAQDKAFTRRHLVVRDMPRSPLAESYRSLRSNVAFLDVDHRPLSIVVTSSLPGEGKSTTAVNLAFTSAEAEQRVLLVDADMRRPSVADYLGLEGAAGLTTVLSGRARFEDVVQPLGLDTSFDVLTTGGLPPNPSELLGSERMAQLLKDISDHYDVVVFDSPPLLPVTDATVLARRTTGAILVASAAKVRRNQITHSAEALERGGARLLGVVLSRVPAAESGAYYGYAPANADQSEIVAASPVVGQDLVDHRDLFDLPPTAPLVPKPTAKSRK